MRYFLSVVIFLLINDSSHSLQNWQNMYFEEISIVSKNKKSFDRLSKYLIKRNWTAYYVSENGLISGWERKNNFDYGICIKIKVDLKDSNIHCELRKIPETAKTEINTNSSRLKKLIKKITKENRLLLKAYSKVENSTRSAKKSDDKKTKQSKPKKSELVTKSPKNKNKSHGSSKSTEPELVFIKDDKCQLNTNLGGGGSEYFGQKVGTKSYGRTSPDWARNYTGSHAAMRIIERYKENGGAFKAPQIIIIDSKNKDPGEKQSHGELTNATIAAYFNGDEDYLKGPYFNGQDKFFDAATTSDSLCRKINEHKEDYSNVVFNLSLQSFGYAEMTCMENAIQKGATMAFSAGNYNPKMHYTTESLGNAGGFIVGNLQESGFISVSSSPHWDTKKKDSVVSFVGPGGSGVSNSEQSNIYNGTSAAVTSATSALAMIGGLNKQLSNSQKKAITEATTTPVASKYYNPPVHGSGLVNMALAVDWTIRLNEKCYGKKEPDSVDDCVQDFIDSESENLKKPSLSQDNKKTLAQIDEKFSCKNYKHESVANRVEPITTKDPDSTNFKTDDCNLAGNLVLKLRELALLNPYSSEPWEKLACVNTRLGNEIDAEHYNNLAQITGAGMNGKKIRKYADDYAKTPYGKSVSLYMNNPRPYLGEMTQIRTSDGLPQLTLDGRVDYTYKRASKEWANPSTYTFPAERSFGTITSNNPKNDNIQEKIDTEKVIFATESVNVETDLSDINPI